jgi:DNA-directed RNA polymerase subunit beta
MNILYNSFFSQIKTPLENKLMTSDSLHNISSFYSRKSLRKLEDLNSFCFFRQTRIKKKFNTKITASKILSNLDKLMSIEYSLDNYHRSNQDTCLVHKPSVFEGQWVQSGDLLADCSASVGGELSLGQNILIAYMPWEGYNFEDAILVSERLVYDDLYTSIHIERYEVEIRDTKLGVEEITREIPDIREESIRHLDSSGIAKLGSWVEEGDILIGKVTPINKKSQSNYQKLLYTILEKPVLPVRDSSLRAPKGIKAKVVGIQFFKKNKNHLLETQKKGDAPAGDFITKAVSAPYFLAKAVSTKKTIKVNNLKTPLVHNLNSLIKEKIKKKKIKPLTALNHNTRQPTLNLNKSFFNSPEFLHMYTQSNILNKMQNKQGISGCFNTTNKNKISSFSYYGFTTSMDVSTPNLIPFTNKIIVRKNLATLPYLSTFRNPIMLFDRGMNQVLINNKNKSSNSFSSLNKLKNKHSVKTFFYGDAKYTAALAKKKLDVAPQGMDLVFMAKPSKQKKMLSKTKLSNLKSTGTVLQKREKNLLNGVSSVQVYLAEKRRIQVGDKMAGRHGNKGIISQILPVEDMPFLPDGTPLDMVLNPLGVPSRMNVGQIYECLLGLAGKHLGENFKVFPFDEIYGAEASRSFVYSKLYEARVKTGKSWLFNPHSAGKVRLYDGRTGETFDQAITVGYAYMLRLVHMVDDKIHARSTGPYSLVTQQPLRGRSKQGGQRLGEMEVWALEGYGAAFTLLEMLTIKSDDMTGRMTLWSNLILNKEISIGTPESFKVLICELQALCLDIGLFRVNAERKSPWDL